MDNNTLYILFGFGGSGGKTIRHLAEIMTNDPVAAEKASERLHFVLCDTDLGDLRASADGIREAFRTKVPGMDPQVETFALGHGVDIFPDLVSNRVESTDPDGRSRLKQHWWFQPQAGPDGSEEVPFSASRLPLSVAAGAGQCPMVSHFLAWDGLRRFEELLERISMHAQNRRNMENFHVELMLVAGLAGGTGRGCWQTLSLKTREYFGRRQQSCRPTGFFFDATVFSDIQRGRPDQKVKLQVNGLTGLSELAMWLRSDLDGVERRFSLPDLRNPGDPRVDVIDTEHYMPESKRARKGRCPVHRAYIFTNEGGVWLDRSDDAYRMAAAAIYGRFAVSNTRSADANTPARAMATATSVMYVPISDIRRSVQLKAKARRVTQFLHGSEAARNAAQAGKSQLVAWLGQLISLPGSPQDLLELARTHGEKSMEPSIAGILGQRHRSEASGAGRGPMNLFNESLRRGKTERTAAINALSSPGGAQVPPVFFDAVCRALGIPDIEEARGSDESRDMAKAADLVWQRIVRGGVGAGGGAECLLGLSGASSGSIGSISVLREAIEEIAQRVDEAIKECSTGDGENDRDSVESLRRQLHEHLERKRNPIGFLPLVPDYSEGSRASLRELAAQVIVAARIREYRKCFRDMLGELRARVDVSKKRLDEVVGAANRLEASCNHQANELAKTVFLGFGDPDPRRMLEELRREHAMPMSKVVRCLRPIADRAAYDQLVSKALESSGGALYEEKELLGTLTSLEGDSADSIFSSRPMQPREQLRYGDRLLERLRQMVDRQELPLELLREFTVDRVLAQIVEQACDLYSKNAGDVAFRRELSEAVEGLTGIDLERLDREREEASRVDPARKNETLRAPSEARIVASAALQLATRCDPPVHVGGPRERTGDLVTVLLPDLVEGALTTRKAVEDAIDPMWRSRGTEFHHVQVGALEDNPFMIAAVSDLPKRDFEREGWSGWTTFDYWRSPEIQRWLQRVENADGESIFCTEDDSIGLGYISPQYVRDQHWASRRWRPWFDNRRVTAQTQRKWYALAYALLGNAPYRAKSSGGAEEPWLRHYRSFLAELAKKHSINPQHPNEQFTLPLLKEEPGGEGPRFMRRLFTAEGGAYRQTGLDLVRPGGPGVSGSFKSMRSFIEWFRGDESSDVLAKVWAEQPIMCRLLRDPDLYEVTSPAHRADVNVALREYVREWREHVEKAVTREDDRKNQTEFLGEFAKVIAEPGFDVLQPFDGSVGA